MGEMSPTHWLIVIGVLVLLFGAKKFPEMARSVGQSARVFKGEMKGLRDGDAPTGDAPTGGAEPSGSNSWSAPAATSEASRAQASGPPPQDQPAGGDGPPDSQQAQPQRAQHDRTDGAVSPSPRRAGVGSVRRWPARCPGSSPSPREVAASR